MAYAIQTPPQLSTHLRALRRAKGLSQSDLGAKLGLSQARVARIEGDPLSISVEQLLRVFAALGVRMGLEELPSTAGDTTVPSAPFVSEPLAKPPIASQDGDW
ncbi:helix-turn-helix domain-containing protein [Rhodoferax sp. WC2427]|uniref:helix-turn-helix domain-containing protein n=1 Tax=Rhodoferax sp. WC2427 TaxID=3234144 RepID=UPI0034673AB3